MFGKQVYKKACRKIWLMLNEQNAAADSVVGVNKLLTYVLTSKRPAKN